MVLANTGLVRLVAFYKFFSENFANFDNYVPSDVLCSCFTNVTKTQMDSYYKWKNWSRLSLYLIRNDSKGFFFTQKLVEEIEKLNDREKAEADELYKSIVLFARKAGYFKETIESKKIKEGQEK